MRAALTKVLLVAFLAPIVVSLDLPYGGGAGAVIAHTISLTPNTTTNVIVGTGGGGGVGGYNGGSWGGMPGASGGNTYFLSDTATGGSYGSASQTIFVKSRTGTR